MAIIETTLLRQQLNIIGNDQDQLIEHYRDAAISFIENHCDRKIVEVPTDDPKEMQVGPEIRQAIMQLVGMMYRDRESQPLGNGGAPYVSVIDRLLWPLKRF